MLSQDPDEGVALLREVLKADPSWNDAHYYLGTGLMALAQDQNAIHEFDQAIAAEPTADLAMTSYYKLAQLYKKLHQTDEAQTAMRNFTRLRAATAERQGQRAAQVARKRTELPVEDPEKIAQASTVEDQ